MIKPLEKQTNHLLALEHGFRAVAVKPPSCFDDLGARRTDKNVYDLPVLHSMVSIDVAEKTIITCGQSVDLAWRILILHYLKRAAFLAGRKGVGVLWRLSSRARTGRSCH